MKLFVFLTDLKRSNVQIALAKPCLGGDGEVANWGKEHQFDNFRGW